jgi:CDP-glycerol glycerophosphotransferase
VGHPALAEPVQHGDPAQGVPLRGEILETGYPRNDALRRPDATRSGPACARRSSCPRTRRPCSTSPRGGTRSSTRWRSTCRCCAASSGTARRCSSGPTAHGAHRPGRERPGVRNVSRWPDVTELYLAADVLLTDYSSAMVDFAATGKPLLLYTHDLERYRDEIRGFTIAFEEEVPSPLLRTSAEVAAALADVPGATAPVPRALRRLGAALLPVGRRRRGGAGRGRRVRARKRGLSGHFSTSSHAGDSSATCAGARASPLRACPLSRAPPR